jgi:hypothetical protein
MTTGRDMATHPSPFPGTGQSSSTENQNIFPGLVDSGKQNSKFYLLALASCNSITILPAPFQFAMPLPDND